MQIENYIISILVVLITILFSVFSVILAALLKRKDRIKVSEIKDIVVNKESSNTEETIKNIMETMPVGLTEDEYFKRLRKVLLEISYLQVKNPTNSDKDNALYTLLETHHQQALQQSHIQFWFSLLSSIIGFCFIIVMLLIMKSTQWYEYILRTLPGLIIEVVSVLFFNQARETRDRATKFFRELNYEKQISKSVSIADTIDDDNMKSQVKSKIALHIIGIYNTEQTE